MYRNADASDADEPRSDDGVRVLELVKNNYGPRGAQILLRLDAERHVLIGTANATSGDDIVSSIARNNERKAVLAAVGEALARSIAIPTATTNASTAYEALECLPAYPASLRGKTGKARLFRLLRQLRADGELEVSEFRGSGRHRRECYRLPGGAA
jgi:hypothetical protein